MKTFDKLIMGIAVLTAAGCASAPRQTPTVNVTGNWVGDWVCDNANLGSGIAVLKLAQNGEKVTGSATVTPSAGGPNRTTDAFQGTVSGDSLIVETWPDLPGTFTVAGDRMSGQFRGVVCGGRVALNREPFKGTAETSRLSSMAAKVEAIDLPTRMITLRGPKGGVATMQVDERVKNLPQVSVGDTVTVAYYESWALKLDQPGAAGGTLIMGSAAPGQMPAGYTARQTTIRATVEAIDAAKPSVTFRGPKGTTQEVNVSKDPRILSQLKTGETYDVVYTESLAVAVEKAPKP